MQDRELDLFLRQARANPPQPSADFMARVLAQALAEQPEAPRETLVQPLEVRTSRWGMIRHFAARLSAVLGGRAAFAGLALAALLGGWIGYTDPAGLSEDYSIYADAGLEMSPLAELLLIEG